jgi:hypothetical protein
LNRRCQQAESALPDYRKIIAVPPDGDGVRFVSGSLGRALAVSMCAKLEDEVASLRELVREMHAADAAYGCGFYNDDRWLTAYRGLRKLVGPLPGGDA